MTLETERLILRQFKLSDLDDFYEYAKNPKVGIEAGWKPHNDREESKIILKFFVKDKFIWALELKENKKVIGSIGLHDDTKRDGINSKMIGYVLSEKYWGKGLMVEAVKAIMKYGFENLALEVISIYHYEANIRSKRVIEKCGFKYEGTLRRAIRRFDNQVKNDVCYSLLREEYNMFSKFENID